MVLKMEATEAVLGATAAERESVLAHAKCSGMMHTSTEAVGEANGLSCLGGTASLVGAVANTVAEAGVVAVA